MGIPDLRRQPAEALAWSQFAEDVLRGLTKREQKELPATYLYDELGRSGYPQGNFRLIERYTRIDANTIEYRFTADDPTTWTAPWTASIPMRRTADRMYEYACHEGNFRSLEGMFRAARVQEREQK